MFELLNKTIVVLLIVAGFVCGISYASNEALIEDVVVTGVYSPQTALTSTVSVLDAEQIALRNKRSINDLLKTVPGLLIEQQGGAGGLSAVSIRGAESNFTLVLNDGVSVNDPTNFRGGGFDFANLNSSLVERIEVVRGAQSTIYGSAALAGVINIITRKPGNGHNQEIVAEVGEDKFSSFRFSALGKLGELDYAVELASRDGGDAVAGSTRTNDSANLRIGWQITENQRMTATYRVLDGDRTSYPEQSGGPVFALIDALDESDYSDQLAAISWESQHSENMRSRFSATWFTHQEDYTSPGIAPFFEVPPNTADTRFQRNLLQWTNTLQFSGGYRLDIGADYRDESGKSAGSLDFFGFLIPTDFKLDRGTTGLFASLSASPGDRLLLQGSARYDDADGFDKESSFAIGASYDLKPGMTVSANWGEAFKLPSFFALGHALVGNAELRPERATNWDLGITWERDEKFHLDATYFSNEFNDLVDFDPDEFRNINRKNIETSGIELQVVWQPHHKN